MELGRQHIRRDHQSGGLADRSAAAPIVNSNLAPSSPQRLHPGLFTLICFAIGCGFFWLREKWRWLYALIEIGFGVISLYSAAPVIEGGDFSQAFGKLAFGGAPSIRRITVIGAVYLIVRGLDNLDKAMEKSPRWNWLRAKVRIPRR